MSESADMELTVVGKFEHKISSRACKIPCNIPYETRFFKTLETELVRDRGSDKNKLVPGYQIYGGDYFTLELNVQGGHEGGCTRGTWTFSMERDPYSGPDLCVGCRFPHVAPLNIDVENYNEDMSGAIPGEFRLDGEHDHVHFRITARSYDCICDTVWMRIEYEDCECRRVTKFVPFHLITREKWEAIHGSRAV